MILTARALNRATLARQLLLRREELSVRDGVRRIVALQAQQAASPYIALWNRLAGFDPADLDAAFADGTVVKATLMRITLHAVHTGDYAALHRAMVSSLRAARLGDRRFTRSGLSIPEVDAFVPELVEFTARTRTVAEIEEFIEARLGADRQGLWWALRTFAPLHHAPTGGAWSFGTRSAFRAAGEQLQPERRGESVSLLVRRYLEGFGPASARDVAQFSLLTRPVIREALDALADEVLELEGPARTVLYDLPGAPLPDEDTPAPPRLMAMWDSTLLAYVDRSRVIPPDYRQLVTRRNGDVLPTVLVDGYVAGVWRVVEEGIEVTAFHPLPDQAWAGLVEEARGLMAFLAKRDSTVYSRYHRWWSTLPSAEVRRIP